MDPETMIEIAGDGAPVQLCVQTAGDPADPAILLIHGACASMVWWEEELCERLAAGGRYVVRFDNRDTGRSTCCPPGRPDYAHSDLVSDAVGILDALGVEKAHVVGRSMAGGTALALAVDHPDRVATATFVTTTTGDVAMGEVAPPAAPDYADDSAVVDYVVGVIEAYSGGSPYFEPARVRALVERDVARTRSVASANTNHFLIDFDTPRRGGFADVAVPALVVQGELDPLFPLPHGEALVQRIPGAHLLVLPQTGHDVPPATWDLFVPALLAHTA